MRSILPALLLAITFLQNHSFVIAQSARQAAQVDSLFSDLNKPGKPGAAVGVVYQGKLIYAKGFGEADVETGAPITPETIFHVASVSKQFTAYGIVLLAQEGKLSLDDSIQKYLPEVPNFGKTITIRHLIYHTSGLRDQWRLLTMAGWRMDDVITKDQVFNLVKRQKELDFEPGSAFGYCNTGYTLLAEIVARVGQKPFPVWIDQHVFKALGMKNSLFYNDHECIVKGRAYSFHESSDTVKKSVLSFANVGATSLFTTVNDLAKWIGNFRSPMVGTQATMTQMLERGRLTMGDTLPYAFALTHDEFKGLAYYGHSGGDAGFGSYLCYFPKEDYGFIVLSNKREFNINKKIFEVADIFLSSLVKEEMPGQAPVASPSAPPAYKFDSTLFRKYQGEYALNEEPDFVMSFKREGDHYYARANGQSQIEMFPFADTTFFLKSIGASIIFHITKESRVNKITLRQNGERQATRVRYEPLTNFMAGQFSGKYYSPELETLYTIEPRGSKLKMLHVHHGETDLKVISKDRLNSEWSFVRNIDVVRDSGGKVTGLRMSNDRVKNLWFKRLPDNFAD